jgi:hypothetical protein
LQEVRIYEHRHSEYIIARQLEGERKFWSRIGEIMGISLSDRRNGEFTYNGTPILIGTEGFDHFVNTPASIPIPYPGLCERIKTEHGRTHATFPSRVDPTNLLVYMRTVLPLDQMIKSEENQ